MTQPEDQTRENIDRMLTSSGWAVRDQNHAHISAYRGLAIHNFSLKQCHGFAEYMLYVDGRADGVIEAKKRRRYARSRRDSVGEPAKVKALDATGVPFVGVWSIYAEWSLHQRG